MKYFPYRSEHPSLEGCTSHEISKTASFSHSARRSQAGPQSQPLKTSPTSGCSIHPPIAGPDFTATTPAAATAAHPDHAGQRERPRPRLGFPDQSECQHQVDAHYGRRHPLLHRAGQCLGDRCALGHMLWHYQYPPNKGDHIGQRGVAIYKDSIYFMSPDAHMISPEREKRQHALEDRGRGRRKGLLGDQRR